jgi:hypothetical protein
MAEGANMPGRKPKPTALKELAGNPGNTAPTGWDTYEDNVDWDDTSWIGPI